MGKWMKYGTIVAALLVLSGTAYGESKVYGGWEDRWQKGGAVYAVDAGSSDSYVITLDPPLKVYTTGMVINFYANTANTGAATLNANGLGAKTILKRHNVALGDGDIEAGQLVTVIYDGTYFQMQSQVATGSDVSSDTLWDAKGDIAVGTGSNAGARLAVGTAYQVLHVATDTPGWTSTLGATGTRLTKGWFTDLEITNAPTINGAAWTTILQPLDSDLTTIAGLAPANGKIMIGDADPKWSLSAFTLAAPGTTGNILKSDGNNWTSSDTLSIATLNLTSSTSSIPWPVGSGSAANTTEGSAYWESDTDTLTIGDGATGIGLNLTANTVITFPGATSTLASLAGSETLTNKTIGGGSDDAKVVLRENTTDGNWNGITLNRTCAAATAFGVPVYIDSNGKAAKANAAAAATMPAIGLVVVAAAQADDPCTVLTHGTITEDDWTWTAGNTIYVDDSGAGVLTATVGNVSGTDHVVQVIGIALSDDTLFVNPSLSTITLE